MPQDLVNRDLPVVLIGDYNVMPTDLDTYKPEKYINNALCSGLQTKRGLSKSLVDQGWTDAHADLVP
jgi:exonuclease III